VGTKAERLSFHSPDPETTARAAQALAEAFGSDDPGLVISLRGHLGAGKTVFVKGLAVGFGIEPALVSSPTYVIVNQYPAAPDRPRPRPLHHVDFYRLESADELESAGFYDLLGERDVVAVEWGDRFSDALPRDRLEISLQREPTATGSGDADASPRRIEVNATGPHAALILERWRVHLPQG